MIKEIKDKRILVVGTIIVTGIMLFFSIKGQQKRNPSTYNVKEASQDEYIWKGIIPGKTKIEELQESDKATGIPYNADFFQEQYAYESSYPKTTFFYDKNNVIQAINIPVSKAANINVQMSALVNKSPDKIMYANCDRNIELHIYRKEGVALEVNKYSNEIYSVYTFEQGSSLVFTRIAGKIYKESYDSAVEECREYY